MTNDAQAQRLLWSRWIQLWNGDEGKAAHIVAPTFRLHAAMLDGSSDQNVRGPDGLLGWIRQTRGAFEPLTFTTVVGPLPSDDHVVGRWNASGTYRGGMPNAKAKLGTAVSFDGTDILRIEAGRIVEYWISSDTTSMLAQLQAF